VLISHTGIFSALRIALPQQSGTLLSEFTSSALPQFSHSYFFFGDMITSSKTGNPVVPAP
jgi:hypothetical protein